MNQQTESRFNLNIFLAVLFIGAVIAAIVMAALAFDVLWSLIGGVFVVGVIVVALAWIGVNLFSRWTDARIKDRAVKFEHVEHMAKIGYIPAGQGIRYEPLRIAGPVDLAVSTRDVRASTVAAFRDDALNLLALSKQELGADSQQVLPYYKARQNEYFRDVKVWTQAVQYLLVHQIAWQDNDEGKQNGTFLQTGTIGQAYAMLRGDNQPPYSAPPAAKTANIETSETPTNTKKHAKTTRKHA